MWFFYPFPKVSDGVAIRLWSNSPRDDGREKRSIPLHQSESV